MNMKQELLAVKTLVDSLIKDYDMWRANNCLRWDNSNRYYRPGCSRTGMKNTIRMIRRMLLQIEKEIEK